jgi:hypothetical protein
LRVALLPISIHPCTGLLALVPVPIVATVAITAIGLSDTGHRGVLRSNGLPK